MTSWLRCRVSQGMLPGEFTVVTNTAEGKEISLFAPAQFVLEGQGLIAVTIIDQQADRSLVALPVEPLETPSKTVTVATKELVQKAA
jgi:hypothetical protein